MAESTILENPETGDQEKHVPHFKMKMMQDHKAEGVDGLLQESLAGKNIVFSDKSTSYVNIADYVDVHISVVSDQQSTKNTFWNDNQ
ncbi:MAG: FlaG/FlaF family flagellin (archaellin) [Psychroserpens sp.]|jgi:FlaG/FlaF family flagellin (archaellin)